MRLLMIAAALMLASSLTAMVWIFVDSSRQQIAATLHRSVATVVVVAATFGALVALDPSLLREAEVASRGVIVIGAVAGTAGFVNLVSYLRSPGPKPAPGPATCPRCRGALDSRGRCPRCDAYEQVMPRPAGLSFGQPPMGPEGSSGGSIKQVGVGGGSPLPAQATSTIPEAGGGSDGVTRVLSNPPTTNSVAWLACVEGSALGSVFVLRGEAMVLGRGEGSDLSIGDEYVSRRHAMIRREGDRYAIEDLGTTNRTRLNGRVVEQETLRDKDHIRVGASEFVFLQVRFAAQSGP